MSNSHATLSPSEIQRGVSRVLSRKQTDPLVEAALTIEIQSNLDEQIEDGGKLFALDHNVTGGGGAVFLWEDMLSMDDAFHVLELGLNPLSPEKQARLLVRLVLFWRHLRGTRVMLDETSFQVLLCVKQRASATDAEITETTGLSDKVVSTTVTALAAREYRDGIKLLERDVKNKWITRF